jgi:hypothetical protein
MIDLPSRDAGTNRYMLLLAYRFMYAAFARFIQVGTLPMRACFLVFVMTSLALSTAATAQPCAPAEMEPVIVREINLARWEWPRGEVHVMGILRPGDGKSRLDTAAFEELQLLARSEAISLRSLQPPSGTHGGVNLGNIIMGATQGIAARYNVEPGNIRVEPSYQETNESFSISVGVAFNPRVVRVESYQGGGQRFCLTHVVFHYRLTEVLRPIVSSRESTTFSDVRKARLLLKEDPFTNGWKIHAADYINADAADFLSETVSQAIVAANLTPSPTGPLVGKSVTAALEHLSGPIPDQTIAKGTHPEIAKVFLTAKPQKVHGAGEETVGRYPLTLGGTSVVSTYALQVWSNERGNHEALLDYRQPRGWAVRTGSLKYGPRDALELVGLGVPKSIAEKLVTGGAPTSNQTASTGVHPEIAKALLDERGDWLPPGYRLSGTVVSSKYALQGWTGGSGGGEALLQYEARGWEVRSFVGSGSLDVGQLVGMGIPRAIAAQLVAGRPR